MGKRARRRAGAPAELSAPPQAATDRAPEPAAAEAGPPTAPWAPLPLTEIAVLVGLVMLVAGFLIGGPAGMAVLVVGLVLGSLAGLEQAYREHRSGYKPHSAVLAALPAVLVVGLLLALGLPRSLLPFIGVGVAIALWMPIRSAWNRRDDDSRIS